MQFKLIVVRRIDEAEIDCFIKSQVRQARGAKRAASFPTVDTRRPCLKAATRSDLVVAGVSRNLLNQIFLKAHVNTPARNDKCRAPSALDLLLRRNPAP